MCQSVIISSKCWNKTIVKNVPLLGLLCHAWKRCQRRLTLHSNYISILFEEIHVWRKDQLIQISIHAFLFIYSIYSKFSHDIWLYFTYINKLFLAQKHSDRCAIKCVINRNFLLSNVHIFRQIWSNFISVYMQSLIRSETVSTEYHQLWEAAHISCVNQIDGEYMWCLNMSSYISNKWLWNDKCRLNGVFWQSARKIFDKSLQTVSISANSYNFCKQLQFLLTVSISANSFNLC